MTKLPLAALLLTSCLTFIYSPSEAASTVTPIGDDLKPFTTETNYMSLSGYARWNHFKKTGAWMPPVEVLQLGDQSFGGLNEADVLWELKRMIARNPLAYSYSVTWYIDRWGTDWHDYFTTEYVYERKQRKFYRKGSREVYPLNDALIDNVLQKHGEFLKRGLTHQQQNQAYLQWRAWWKLQP